MPDITSKEAGKLGGDKTLKLYGKEHFKKITLKKFEGMTSEQISEYMKTVSHARFNK